MAQPGAQALSSKMSPWDRVCTNPRTLPPWDFASGGGWFSVALQAMGYLPVGKWVRLYPESAELEVQGKDFCAAQPARDP